MPHQMTAGTSPEVSRAKLIVDKAKKKLLDAGHFIPPDPDEMNDRRAAWAQAAVTEFERSTRTEDGDALTDLFTALQHLCDRRHDEIGWNFEQALNRSRGQYQEETEEKETSV